MKQLNFGQPLFFILQKKKKNFWKKEKEKQVTPKDSFSILNYTHDKNAEYMLTILAWTAEQVPVKTLPIIIQ